MDGQYLVARNEVREGAMSGSWKGKELQPFNGKTVFSPKKHNEVIECLNPLNNIEVTEGGDSPPSVKYSDKKVSIKMRAPVPQSSSALRMHPFKLYQAAVGVGDDTTRPWRYWACRGGLIEFPGTFNHFRLDYSTVISGSDGVVNGPSGNTLDYFTDSITPDWTREDVIVSNTGDHGVATPDHGARFILDGTSDGNLCVGAGFWLEGTKNGSGNYFDWQVKCRMWSNLAGTTGRGSDPFPAEAPNIIPIGVVIPPGGMNGGSGSGPATLLADQYRVTHILKSEPNPGYYWNVIGTPFVDGGFGPMRFRGYWEATDAFGLSGEFFYHGDVVVVRSAGETATVSGGGGGTITLQDYWQAFVKLGNAVVASIPATGDPAWQPLNGI